MKQDMKFLLTLYLTEQAKAVAKKGERKAFRL